MVNKCVEIGSFDIVLIEKMFGPTVMCDIRITADAGNCKWIIEREKLVKDDKGYKTKVEWEKMCEFDAQESIFKEGE